MKKKRVLLALDLGTSGVKCSVFSEAAEHLASQYREYKTYFSHIGWQEQRPVEWIDSIRDALLAMQEVLSESEICAIGVSGHSLGAIPVDENGALLCGSVPIWSDSRATKEADAFFEKTDYDVWYEKTGNGFPPHLYALFKVMWYQRHLPEIYDRAVSFVGSKDYINLYLTGVLATDRSYASGSGLYDLKKGEYIEEYACLAGVDMKKFPNIYPSHAVIGRVSESASAALEIPAGIPVVAGGVDNACMTLGAGCFEAGDCYASLGSSAWVTVCAREPLTDQKSGIYTFAHCVEGMFIPSVGIFSSGSALDWVAKNFFPDFSGKDRFEKIECLAAQSETGARGLIFNPCLAGGSSADPSPNTRGCLFHLSLGHKREDIARAALEGIAMHLYAAAEPMLRDDHLAEPLLLVGGGAKGAFARQIYADVFGIKTAVSRIQQGAASLGAAALAALGCGVWDSLSPLKMPSENVTEYAPQGENHKKYEAIFPNWKRIRKACAEIGDAIAEMEKR